MVALVMEEDMLDMSSWSGQVGMVLGGKMYVSMTDEEQEKAAAAKLAQLVRQLIKQHSLESSESPPRGAVCTASVPVGHPPVNNLVNAAAGERTGGQALTSTSVRSTSFRAAAATSPPLPADEATDEAADESLFRAGSFSSAAALQTFLSERGVDTSLWGSTAGGKTYKGVAHLWQEIENGESTLQELDKKIIRNLRVVTIRVMRPGSDQYLYEAKQELQDGRTRVRDIMLSEKLVGNENVLTAAERGLREELGSVLGSDRDCVQMDPSSVRQWTKEESSFSCTCAPQPSYFMHSPVRNLPLTCADAHWRLLTDPTLMANYTYCEVTALVQGLSSQSFTTDEYRGDKLYRRHFWAWKESDEPCNLSYPSKQRSLQTEALTSTSVRSTADALAATLPPTAGSVGSQRDAELGGGKQAGDEAQFGCA